MSSLAELISLLASPDSIKRTHAAEELYRLGKELADAATSPWLRDPEFAALISGAPTVGIAVHPASFEKIRAAFGSPRLADVPPDQDALEFELHAGAAHLDILTTHGSHGAIAKFLEKFGEGIQQIEFPTSNVDRASAILRSRFNTTPIYPAIRPGADNTRVNFFLASAPDARKALIELVESPHPRT